MFPCFIAFGGVCNFSRASERLLVFCKLLGNISMFSCTWHRFHALLRFASNSHIARFAPAAYLAWSSDQLIGSFTFLTIPEVRVWCSGWDVRGDVLGWGVSGWALRGCAGCRVLWGGMLRAGCRKRHVWGGILVVGC